MTTERKNQGKRGLRTLATLQTRLVNAKPANRTQAVSRYARLENERMRIQRELDAWNARRLEAERMLAAVDAELDTIKAMLLGTPAAATKTTSAQRTTVSSRTAHRRAERRSGADRILSAARPGRRREPEIGRSGRWGRSARDPSPPRSEPRETEVRAHRHRVESEAARPHEQQESSMTGEDEKKDGKPSGAAEPGKAEAMAISARCSAVSAGSSKCSAPSSSRPNRSTRAASSR